MQKFPKFFTLNENNYCNYINLLSLLRFAYHNEKRLKWLYTYVFKINFWIYKLSGYLDIIGIQYE